MNESTIHKLNIFLQEYPLYREFLAVEKYENYCEGYTNPLDIQGQTFDYYCDLEKDIKTFELIVPEKSRNFWGEKPGHQIPEELFNEEHKLNFIEHFTGICKSCNKNKVEFLLKISSDDVVSKSKLPSINRIIENNKKGIVEIKPSIYIQKIGVYPELKPEIDKTISKYFDRETNNWYFKAIKSLNENFGIGSFAYFRRIVEKELIKIINDLSHIESEESNHIKELLEKYNKTEKVYHIYENIFEFLPSSLKGLGDNPFQLLYKQTSKGLHNLSEQECLKRANNINQLLKFVIIKINEEKSEILKIRQVIKDLKK
jgi:hypothetical protein